MVGTSTLTDQNPIHLATCAGSGPFCLQRQPYLQGVRHWANQRGERTKHGNLKPSAVPESVRAVHDEGHAADPTFGDELPLSPAQSKSAGTIDLAIAADEPEQVIRYLIVAAQEWIDASENTEKWKAIIAQLAVLAETARAIERASVTQGC